jgi:hypothetical protein
MGECLKREERRMGWKEKTNMKKRKKKKRFCRTEKGQS